MKTHSNRWLSGAWERPFWFAVFLLLFAAPVVLQHQEASAVFRKHAGVLMPLSRMASGTLAACLLAMGIGLVAFRRVHRLAWVCFLLVLGLAMIHSEEARAEWSVWRNYRTANLWSNYLLECVFLAALAAIVAIGRSGAPVVSWARGALGAAAILQASVVLAQFFVWKFGGAQTLQSWGLGGTLLFARDSFGTYADAPRLTGLTRNPNLLSIILLMSWPAFLPAAKGSAGVRRWGLLLLCGICILATLLTYSRAAFLGLSMQLVLAAVLWERRRDSLRRHSLLGAMAILGMLLALCAVVPRVGARFAAIFDLRDGSVSHRLGVYEVAARLVLERPLSGHGPGFFNTLYGGYYRLPDVRYDFYDVHSSLLHLLLEVGLAGAALGVLAIAGTAPRQTLRALPPFVLYGLAGSFFGFLTDNPTTYPQVLFPLLWLLSAAASVAVIQEQAASERQEVTGSPGGGAFPLSPGLVRQGGMVGLLMAAYLGNYLIAPKDPLARFSQELAEAWRGNGGDANYCLVDEASGAQWSAGSGGQRPAGTLSHLLVAHGITRTTGPGDEKELVSFHPKSVPGETGVLEAADDTTLTLSLRDCLFAALGTPSRSAALALVQHVGLNRLNEALGRDGYPIIPQAAGKADPQTGARAVPADWPHVKVNAPMLARLMRSLVDTPNEALRDTVRRGLLRAASRQGLARSLQSYQPVYGFYDETRNRKNEVILFREGNASWTFAVQYTEKVPRVGLDQPPLRAMGRAGLKAYLFLRDDGSDD